MLSIFVPSPVLSLQLSHLWSMLVNAIHVRGRHGLHGREITHDSLGSAHALLRESPDILSGGIDMDIYGQMK